MQTRRLISRLPAGVRHRSDSACSKGSEARDGDTLLGLWFFGVPAYWIGLSSYDAYVEHQRYRKFEREQTGSYRGTYYDFNGDSQSRIKSAREAAGAGFWRDAGWNFGYSCVWPLHALGEGVAEGIDRWEKRGEKLTE